MRALVGTHTFIWMATDDPQLSAAARAFVNDVSNELLLSIASLWEIAIKSGRGRLEIGIPVRELLLDIPSRLALQALAILPEHLVRVAQLPHIHGDPFDRVIVAQALVENLPVVGRDAVMDGYGVRRIW